MTISEAQKRATAKYKAANYSRIPLDVPREFHEYIKARAKQDGQSVNAWIKQAIEERAEGAAENIQPAIVYRLKTWLDEHGHTEQDFIDCLQFIGKE